MAEPKSELRLEIAHVLFIDIVGYSKRLIDEQHELLQDLNQIVRSTEAFRSAEAAGNLIRVPNRRRRGSRFFDDARSARTLRVGNQQGIAEPFRTEGEDGHS